MAKKLIFRSLDRTCGGTGWLNCECGGDFCVCKLNGGTDCLGCEDCREQDEADELGDEDDFNGICGCGEFLTSYGNCPICEPSYLV
jgi:hypothetical protein